MTAARAHPRCLAPILALWMLGGGCGDGADRGRNAGPGDGRLWCWGRNDGGQLGLGVPDMSRPRPSQPVSYQ